MRQIRLVLLSILTIVLALLRSGTALGERAGAEERVEGSVCGIVGCRICFNPEENLCLLCNKSQNFKEEPVSNTCLCE